MAYQLLITDYAMPKLTGAKLIEEVKNIRSDIKVILITGLIEEEVVQQIKQQIIDDFVLKPLDYNELATKIHKLFD
jgi:YesN/AraC family two-component response regulator